MTRQETLDALTNCIFISVCADEHQLQDIEEGILKTSPISAILKERLKWADIGVEISPVVSYIISLCCNGNPGMSIILTYDILRKLKERRGELPKKVIVDDFVQLFPLEFPIMYDTDKYDTPYTEIGREYSAMWDNQKVLRQSDEYLEKRGIKFSPGMPDNLVDYKSYWKELIGDQEEEKPNEGDDK